MDYLIVTTCSNRKRVPVSPELRAHNLPFGTVSAVAEHWTRRLEAVAATGPFTCAADVYCGRAFQEALSAAGSQSKIVVVSAGLGLLDGSDEIPGYSLTVSAGSIDSIGSKVQGQWHPSRWWRHLRRSPFSRIDIAGLFERQCGGVIVFALSAPYYRLIAGDLLSLPGRLLSRARLIGLKPESVHPRLKQMVMPYDNRLEDPRSGYQGTRVDFPQRAVRHFVNEILTDCRGSATEDAGRVVDALAQWDLRVVPQRRRLDDDQIKETIRDAWESTGGRSGLTLRYLRDELGVACEQRRFKELFAQVREGVLEGSA